MGPLIRRGTGVSIHLVLNEDRLENISDSSERDKLRQQNKSSSQLLA